MSNKWKWVTNFFIQAEAATRMGMEWDQNMTNDKAIVKAKNLFGEDSFAEADEREENKRYYVGACPVLPGAYVGYMGYSWEEAFAFAKSDRNK